MMTVEQSRELRLPEEFIFELHHGELVKIVRPKLKHHYLQRKLLDLLKPIEQRGYLTMQVPFRAVPEYDIRVAHFAYLCEEKARVAVEKDDIFGAPDLVIEVLTAFHTASDVFEKEQFCLRNGSKEFWTVDLERKEIRVATEADNVKTYSEGDEIPLAVFGGTVLKVAEVFGECAF